MTRNWILAAALLLLTPIFLPATDMDQAEMERISAIISANYEEGHQLYIDEKDAEAREKLRENFVFEEAVRQIEDPWSGLLDDFKDSGAYYDYVNSWLYAGRASVALKDSVEALRCFSAVQKRVPMWTPIYGEIADSLPIVDIDGQLKVWELCIESFLHPKDEVYAQTPWVPAEPYVKIQMLSMRRGDWARMMDCGEKALPLVDEKRVLPLMYACLAALKTGDAGTAVRFCALAVEAAAPENRDLFGQGLGMLRESYAAGAGAKADPVTPFLLWALADCAGDAETADAQARLAAADARVTDRLQGLAGAAAIDPGCSYVVARFLASSRRTAAAVPWLKRAVNGSRELAGLRLKSDPALSALKEADLAKAFDGDAERAVTPEYYDSVEQSSDYEIVVQDRHHKHVTGAAMSPDGRFIVTGSGDRKVKMWTPDGVLLRSYGSDRGLSCVAYSPTGRYIVAGTEQGSLRLWSVDGREQKTLAGPDFPLALVTVSRDGRYIAATSRIMGAADDFAVRLWSRDGGYLRSFLGHSYIVKKLCFSPDRQYVGSLADNGELRLWDVVSGQCAAVIAPPREGEGSPIETFCFAPSGDGVLVWENPDGLRLLDFHGREVRRLFGAPDTVVDVSASADGSAFVAVCANGLVRTWSAEGKPLGTIAFNGQTVEEAFFTPDGGSIVARTTDEKTFETSLMLRGADGSALHSFPVSSPILVHADMSRDGRHAVSIDSTGAIRLWRTDGELLRTFTDLTGKLDSARFNPSGDRIVIADHGNNRLGELNVNASVWDLDGRLLKLFGSWYGVSAGVATLEGGARRDRDARFLPDGDILLGGGPSMYFYDSGGRATGATIPRDAWDSDVSADGGRIALVGSDAAELWTSSGSLIRGFTLPEGAYSSAVAISPDGRSVAFGCTGALLVFDDTGRLAWRGPMGKESVTDVRWSGDGKRVAACSADATIRVWTSAGALEKTLRGHRDAVRGLAFVMNDRILFSYSDDSTMGIWNLQTGDHYFIAASGSEWITFSDDGYFDCSRDGGGIVAVVKGFTAYGIDQFALAKNRPDILLSRTGMGSAEQIAHYTAQFRKRIAKIAPLPASLPAALVEKAMLPSSSTPAARQALQAAYKKAAGSYALSGSPSYAERLSLMSLPTFAALVEESLARKAAVPRISISVAAQDGPRVSLTLRMHDPSGSLYRYNLYVNDVPVLGSTGREVKGKDAAVRETIDLTPGTNKVEAVCLNARLVESYRDRLFLEGPAGAPGDLYAITFGVSRYEDENLNLNYAHKDAEDLGRLFSAMEGKRFARVFSKVIVNQDATVANVSQAKEFLRNARANDTVVLFIAGHGVHDHDSAATYYYLTHETDLKDLAHSAATFETLEDLLQDIAPRSKLFLMDTCESGEVEDEAPEALPSLAGSRGVHGRGVKRDARGLQVVPSGSAASRDYLNDRDRFVYNDLTRRSGAIVFSSCKGGEVSYETDERENGLFTASLLDVLTGRIGPAITEAAISSRDLARVVSNGVAKESDNLQHPTVDRDNLTQKLYLPILSTGPAAAAATARAQDSMVRVKGGELTLGSDKGPQDQRPAHMVFVDDFLVSACEVTVAEFREFAAATGYATSSEQWKQKNSASKMPIWSDPLFSSDPALPVIGVSFTDAVRFCNWLSEKNGCSPCYTIRASGEITADLTRNGFRLPTEAEWQWAASGGAESRHYRYAGGNRLAEVGWYAGNSDYRTHPVMRLAPNELGLYDMSGNAFEWCNDWYGPKGYTDTTYRNPRGPSEGFDHVLRGGSWSAEEEHATVDARNTRSYWDMQPCVGMRLARNE